MAFKDNYVQPFRTGVVVAADAAATALRLSRDIVRGDALCPRWTKMFVVLLFPDVDAVTRRQHFVLG